MKRKKMLDQLRDFDEQLQFPSTSHCGQSGGVAADDHKVLKHHKSNITNKLRLMRGLRDQHQPRRIQQDKRRNSRHLRLAREYRKSPQKALVENNLIPSRNEKFLVLKTDDTTQKASVFTFQDECSMSAREFYIMSQRDQLDTHYLNLRGTSLHRQAKMLQAYKEFVATKKFLERPAIQNLCSHFVEKIISLTFAIVSESETRPLTEERYVKLRKAHILLDREKCNNDKSINERFKPIREDVVDAEQLFKSWDHLDNQWIAKRPPYPEIPASPAVEALLSNVLTRWIDVMDEKTSQLAGQIWPLLSGFKTVVMYTYELGTISRPFATQVAAQRKMHYLELDSVLDLCADSNSTLPQAECSESSDIFKVGVIVLVGKINMFCGSDGYCLIKRKSHLIDKKP
uniref:AlNc14C89G5639 protein n=1 Tax=Albugo laibachii Nc14 TaxID=890382 RepID=F0WGA9_9STRA|nr:AlNc14C89G5639 [Albugo laibachii Nc14]|eukprot:CCA20244.1 AlNc14C89G5639 [Albugo laibachii Nc14]